MLSEHPVRTVIIGFMVSVQVLIGINLIGDVRDNRVVSPAGAFAPVNFMAPVQDHAMGATILWILIFAALAIFAIRRRVNGDLQRTSPSPAPAAPRPATA